MFITLGTTATIIAGNLMADLAGMAINSGIDWLSTTATGVIASTTGTGTGTGTTGPGTGTAQDLTPIIRPLVALAQNQGINPSLYT